MSVLVNRSYLSGNKFNKNFNFSIAKEKVFFYNHVNKRCHPTQYAPERGHDLTGFRSDAIRIVRQYGIDIVIGYRLSLKHIRVLSNYFPI